ncbi:MAG: TonB family protein [Magnetococcus sp. YQC-3]
MNIARKRLLISLGLAMLLHLALPLAIWWLLTAVPPEREPAVSMVELITLPPEPEAEPEKADAVANANQAAKNETKPDSEPPPPAPAPAPAPPPRAAQAGPMAMPKPVAKPATPKPVAKPIAKAPPATVPDDAPPTPEEPPREAEEMPPEPEKPTAKPPPPAKPAPARERSSRPAPKQTKDLANVPLNLNPSVESLSRWDMNRRQQAQAMAREEEVVDLNTRQSRYVSYFSQVKQRIEMAWIYPAEAKRDKLSGNVGLTFTIQRSGQLLEARVTRSSEMAVLDEAALEAVNKAAPFAPFPDDWTLEKLTIRATFEYIRRELSWQQ